MPLSRRKAITLLAASATVVAVDGIPAWADEQPPMAFSAHSLGFEYLGYLDLYLRAFYSAITQVRAHLISKVDGTEAGTIENFDHFTNDPADGHWTAKNPVLLPSLGYYQVDVEIWTAGGAYAYQRNVDGELTYFALATIGDLQFVPDRPTTDHRFVTVSGQLLDKHPGTLVLSPVAQGKVRLEVGGHATEILSGADGRFSLDVPIEHSTAIGVTAVADLDNHRLADRTSWRIIEPVPAPSRLVVTATPQSVDPGQPITISGVFEAEQGGSWVPLADRKITLTSMGYPLPESPVTTDAQGRFSFTKVFASTTGVTAEYLGRVYGDSYVADAMASVGAHVRHPISFSDNFTVLRYDRSRPTVWRAQGYVKDANDQDRVQIQVAGSPAGPWSTVASTGYGGHFSFGVEFKCDVELFGPRYVRAYSPTTLEMTEAASKAVFVIGAPAPRREPVVGQAPVPRRG